MNLLNDYLLQESRRQFLSRGKNALGMASLATLLQESAGAAAAGGLDATGQRVFGGRGEEGESVPGAEAKTEKLPAARPSDLPPDKPS